MIDINKLKSIIESEIDDSLGYLETDTTDERQEALKYYLREPYGNEVEGKSSIVTGEVVAVGPGKKIKEGKYDIMPVSVGDRIRFGVMGKDEYLKFQPVMDNGEKFLLMSWQDVAFIEETK